MMENERHGKQEIGSDARSADVTLDLVERFNTAFNQHDLDAVMALMTEDCVFENTHPPPDGARYEGRDSVRAAFAEFFASSPNAWFTFEETFAAGERCVVRWLYRWDPDVDSQGYVRGVDLFRVAGGLIAEKLSYVKG